MKTKTIGARLGATVCLMALGLTSVQANTVGYVKKKLSNGQTVIVASNSGITMVPKSPNHRLQLINPYNLPPKFMRQVVPYKTKQKKGTIIVDSQNHYLYLVLGNQQAMRYGIGVARDGFKWTGTHRVTRKAVWPSWTPPSEMLKREPDLPTFMPGGIKNPMGARALYLGNTLYRIHGTNQPWSIGQNVSSGCIRMTNDDVIDLYQRVRHGVKVIVT